LDLEGRTLIVVGRDFDAAPQYWKKMKVGAPADQAAEINRRLTEARAEKLEVGFVSAQDFGWFTLDNQLPVRDVRDLSGSPGWLAGVDPSKAEIELGARMLVPDRPDVEVLLTSGNDVLVSREDYAGSQLILVANGSFLLNLPLVNHEHRKLAGHLVSATGEPGQVYFLETGGEPLILTEEPQAVMPTGLELFTLPTIGLILLHATLLGVVFCFSRLPVFGLARRIGEGSRSDFGEHVQALGELLGKTNDRTYAHGQVEHYFTAVRREPPSRPAELPAAEIPPPRDPWDAPELRPPPLPARDEAAAILGSASTDNPQRDETAPSGPAAPSP
jgi:hypothetical protein